MFASDPTVRFEWTLPQIEWQPVPTSPVLEAGQVHIWHIRLENRLISFDFLSMDERERAERLRFPAERAQFTTSRTILRQLLAGYMGIDAREVAFTILPDGKPVLAGSAQREALHFNVSHSQNCLLLAFSTVGPLGVDVERLRPVEGQGWALTHLFSAKERALLDALPLAQRAAAFMAIWTLKEAAGKADGRGVRTRVDSADMLRLWLEKPDEKFFRSGQLNEFQVFQFSPEYEYCAALAVGSKMETQIRWLGPEKDWIETV